MGQDHNINKYLADVAARHPEDRGQKYLSSTNTLLPKGAAGPVLPGQAGYYDGMRLIQAEAEGDWFPGHGPDAFIDHDARFNVNMDLHAPLDESLGRPDPRYGHSDEVYYDDADFTKPEYTYAKGMDLAHKHYNEMREMADRGMLTPENRKIVNVSPLLLTHPEAKSRRQLEWNS